MSAQPTIKPMERTADSPDVLLENPKAAGMPGKAPATRTKMRQLWVKHTWGARRLYWRMACMLNFHDWEKAVQPDEKTAEVDGTRPTRYCRCRRPECRIYSAKRQLVRVQKWVETDDFIILASLECKHCFGRGYRGTMRLPGNCRAKIPCSCLTIQPEFMEHIRENSPSEKARRKAESHGVKVQ